MRYKEHLVVLSLLTGCVTYDPYTGEQKVSDSTKGAIIGGIAGAALGNQVKGNRKTRDQAMVAGAALGALAGGAIGNNIDKQEAKLRQQLQATGVSVSRNEDQIVLNMPGNITFEKGSSAIRPGFAEILNSVALVLKEYKKSNVEISGHADSKGSMETNQLMSQQRANAVAAYLRSRGIAGHRLTAVGYGKSQTLGSDAESRRVEITINNT